MRLAVTNECRLIEPHLIVLRVQTPEQFGHRLSFVADRNQWSTKSFCGRRFSPSVDLTFRRRDIRRAGAHSLMQSGDQCRKTISHAGNCDIKKFCFAHHSRAGPQKKNFFPPFS